MVDGHPALLGSENDLIPVPHSEQLALGLNVLPRILLPLAGPEEYELDVRPFRCSVRSLMNVRRWAA
jgi:hypothetical protein